MKTKDKEVLVAILENIRANYKINDHNSRTIDYDIGYRKCLEDIIDLIKNIDYVKENNKN